MERLTTRCDGYAVMAWEHEEKYTTSEWIDMLTDRLAAYEDAGLTPEEISGLCSMSDRAKMADLLRMEEYQALGTIDHLRELVQAEKDGRLVVLPFCIGSSLYEATRKGVREYETEQFSIGREDLFIHALDKDIWYRGGRIFGKEQIGETVFLTREEAEAALKKREEANNAPD